jgi:hypothetical protein
MFGFFKSNESKREKALKMLFPIKQPNSKIIKKVLKQVLIESDMDFDGNSILNFSPKLNTKTEQLWNLEFESFGWNEDMEYLIDENFNGRRVWFGNYYPFVLQAVVSQEEYIPQYNERQLETYRRHIRKVSNSLNGGIIFADFNGINDIIIAESIYKQPKEDGPGMDYNYQVTIPDYETYHNYILNFKIPEMVPTGIRDNILLPPISEITGLSIKQLFDKKLYWEDPYDPSIKEGNRMNISEREEFDIYLPHHPLSIIRQHIRKKFLNSLTFI